MVTEFQRQNENRQDTGSLDDGCVGGGIGAQSQWPGDHLDLIKLQTRSLILGFAPLMLRHTGDEGEAGVVERGRGETVADRRNGRYSEILKVCRVGVRMSRKRWGREI